MRRLGWPTPRRWRRTLPTSCPGSPRPSTMSSRIWPFESRLVGEVSGLDRASLAGLPAAQPDGRHLLPRRVALRPGIGFAGLNNPAVALASGMVSELHQHLRRMLHGIQIVDECRAGVGDRDRVPGPVMSTPAAGALPPRRSRPFCAYGRLRPDHWCALR